MTEPLRPPEGQDAWPRWYPKYVLGLLVVVYVCNFVDRTILTILLEPIKRDLGISDTALGFLTGFAFAVFYTFAGIPIARLADRGVRRNIIAVGLVVWSSMTALSGFAQSFLHLALARIGVGVGEAAGSPPAHSIISDYFPVERRATALAIYSCGIPLGSMIGLIAGGWLNELFSWRVAFFVVGVPGLVLALLVRLTIREPPRGYSEKGPVDDSSDSFGDVLRFLLKRRSFVYFGLAAGIIEISGWGLTTWVPAFLMRLHGMESGAIGTWTGLMFGIGGGIGTVLGGLLADRLGRYDMRWYLWMGAISVLLNLPFVLIFLHHPSTVPALLFYFPSYVFWAMYLPALIALGHHLVKVRMRAMASAVFFFLINLIGLGLGPQVAGLVNDLLEPRFGVESIRWSLTLCSSGLVVGSLLLWIASRHLLEDLKARDSM